MKLQGNRVSGANCALDKRLKPRFSFAKLRKLVFFSRAHHRILVYRNQEDGLQGLPGIIR